MSNKNKDKRVNKAARILLALGEENAAEVVKHLDESTIEKVAVEIARINQLPVEEKLTILEEFKESIEKVSNIESGGLHKAHEFLQKAFDKETAQKRLLHLKALLQPSDFEDFERYSPEVISTVLKDELPRTTALVLTQLRSKFAAKVLAQLKGKYRTEVAKLIATASEVAPIMIKTIFKSLSKKLESHNKGDLEKTGGENKLTEIMRHLDRDSEHTLLNNLEKDDPEMVNRIKDKLLVFEDILMLNEKEIRKLMELYPDKTTWGIALKGAGNRILKHTLSSVSVNRSSDIMAEMQFNDSISTDEIETARRNIITAMEMAEKEGHLILRKDKEEYID